MYGDDREEEGGRRMSNTVFIGAACRPRRENLTMKRSVVALGILVLVCAVALPAANAKDLLKDDFSTDALLKAPGTYVQGFGNSIRDDSTLLPFYVRDGVLTSSPPDVTTGSDGTGANNDLGDPPTVQYLLLTGDKSWADVSMQVKARSDGQNTGAFAVILRAAPKTKPTDPDTWYQLTYTTANSETGDTTATKETLTHDEDASGIEATSVVPDLRIMKVVNNKYKILAETDFNKSSIRIPEVNAAGAENENGAIFRFVAKGNVLEAFISVDGVKFEKYLSVTDDELKAGLVGVTHVEYNPVFDDLLVQDAP
jgi:hypothetical protein